MTEFITRLEPLKHLITAQSHQPPKTALVSDQASTLFYGLRQRNYCAHCQTKCELWREDQNMLSLSLMTKLTALCCLRQAERNPETHHKDTTIHSWLMQKKDWLWLLSPLSHVIYKTGRMGPPVGYLGFNGGSHIFKAFVAWEEMCT